MRFSDIRSGLNQATLSSTTDNSEILQSRPMYKNISKTLFSEPEGVCETGKENNKNLQISPEANNDVVTAKGYLLSTQSKNSQYNNQQYVYPVLAGQIPQANSGIVHSPLVFPRSNNENNFQQQQQSFGLVTSDPTTPYNSNVGIQTQATIFSPQAQRQDEQRSSLDQPTPSPQESVPWYQMYPTPESSNTSGSGIGSLSTPRNGTPPECSTTYTPASMCSEPGSTTTRVEERETSQQYGLPVGNAYNLQQTQPNQTNQLFSVAGVQQTVMNSSGFVNVMPQNVITEEMRQAAASYQGAATYAPNIQNMGSGSRAGIHAEQIFRPSDCNDNPIHPV